MTDTKKKQIGKLINLHALNGAFFLIKNELSTKMELNFKFHGVS